MSQLSFSISQHNQDKPSHMTSTTNTSTIPAPPKSTLETLPEEVKQILFHYLFKTTNLFDTSGKPKPIRYGCPDFCPECDAPAIDLTLRKVNRQFNYEVGKYILRDRTIKICGANPIDRAFHPQGPMTTWLEVIGIPTYPDINFETIFFEIDPQQSLKVNRAAFFDPEHYGRFVLAKFHNNRVPGWDCYYQRVGSFIEFTHTASGLRFHLDMYVNGLLLRFMNTQGSLDKLTRKWLKMRVLMLCKRFTSPIIRSWVRVKRNVGACLAFNRVKRWIRRNTSGSGSDGQGQEVNKSYQLESMS